VVGAASWNLAVQYRFLKGQSRPCYIPLAITFNTVKEISHLGPSHLQQWALLCIFLREVLEFYTWMLPS
jgi:hypothetical protein